MTKQLHRWRAKFRRHGKDYSVGSYATEAEKNAAVAAGKQLFERLDKEAEAAKAEAPKVAPAPEVKPAPKNSTPRKPSRPLYSRKQMLEQLQKDIESGRFDTMLEAIIKSAVVRHEMLGRLPRQWTMVGYENDSRQGA